MRVFAILLILFPFSFYSYCQKKLVEFSSSANWPSVGNVVISNNGKYVAYQVNSDLQGTNLFIQDTGCYWKTDIKGGSNPVISDDNKKICFKISNDSVGILDLDSHATKKIVGIVNFKMLSSGKMQWIACQFADQKKGILLRNLIDGRERIFPSIKSYVFDGQAESILLESENTTNGTSLHALIWANLRNETKDTIWKGNKQVYNVVFDVTGKKMLFQEEVNVNSIKSYFLYYFQSGDLKALPLVSNSTKGMDFCNICRGNVSISKDGRRVFFCVSRTKENKINTSQSSSVKVNIWSYADDRLQSEQLHDLGKDTLPRLLKACINLEDNERKAIILEREDDKFVQLPRNGNGEYALAWSFKGNRAESYWRVSARFSYYFVSLKDGSRRLIQSEIPAEEQIWSFSGSGKYIIRYNGRKGTFLTLDISTGKITEITNKINVPIFSNEDFGFQHKVTYPYGIARWLDDDTAVLIYDKFDIWRLNPNGTGKPINVTGGYGRKHRIRLRLSSIPAPDGSTILEGFNDRNKSTGFFKIALNKEALPHKLTMGPYHPQNLIKAKSASVYLIDRSNATTFPNWFVTCDFVQYSPLTNTQPQKEYNWYKTVLLRWKMINGKIGEGVLYKPTDFDSHKKYPLIFLYYEKDSYQLNRFLLPSASEAEINIPWFVSRGYLVFVPDIYYKPGYPGWSAYNSVVSSAKYLSGMPWVDARHMGLQGHSFGGYETNYIVSRTNLFAAAVSTAGLSDLISYTFGLRGYTGESNQELTEYSQLRIFTTLWKHPELYIKNSPIFYADRINTPLLIIHNKKDDAVPQSQSIELFTALRRLGKKTWMLEYEDEGHAISKEENKQDYSIRVEQFFCHYLKGGVDPKWMMDGVPASKKGIDSGLEPAVAGKQTYNGK